MMATSTSLFSSKIVVAAVATIFIISGRNGGGSSCVCHAFRISVNQPPRLQVAASQLRMTSETEEASAAVVDRREALGAFAVGLFGAAAASVQGPPRAAYALDMDAFANSELASDQAKCNPKVDPKCIPKLTPDEAMCKYGQSGDARGEACRRVKEGGGPLPGKSKEKSLGGAYAM